MTLKWRRLQFILLAAAFGNLFGCSSAQRNPWSEQVTAASGAPLSIGGYAAGCLVGAQSLPPDGRGFHVMRPSRRRHYGHPTLIAFLYSLGAKMDQAKLGSVFVGDLGQPRGGPMTGGHLSHQTGLDVDLWYDVQPAAMKGVPITLDERENRHSNSILKSYTAGLHPQRWGKAQMGLLKLTAQHESVERILTDPWVKKAFCDSKDKGKPWLAKVRPYWSHHDHLHVRLKCPPESTDCKVQEAVPPGDGCDETLAWWFTEEGMKSVTEKEDPSRKEKFKLPELPKECSAYIEQK